MTHTEHSESHRMGEPQFLLLYGLNNKPLFQDALLVGLQHICAILILVCTPGFLHLTRQIFTPLVTDTAVS